MSDKFSQKKIIDQASTVLTRIRSMVELHEQAIGGAKTSLETIRDKKVLAKMANLPLDKIQDIFDNKEVISKLQKCGINSIASLHLIGEEDLLLLTSLPSNLIANIKVETLNIYKSLSELTPLKIDYEQISKEEVKLLDSIKNISSLGSGYEEKLPALRLLILKIDKNLRDAEVINSKIKWLFSSKESKEKALNAVNTLRSLLTEEETAEMLDITQAAESKYKKSTSEDTLWDFKNNSSEYYSIIENKFGFTYNYKNYLSEELVRTINNTEFDEGLIKANLRRYQIFGIKFALTQKRVILGDEMGLGKTIQALGVVAQRIKEGGSHFIVVCPRAVLVNWQREIEGRSDIKVIKIHGSTQNQSFENWLQQGGLAMTTFDTLKNLDARLLSQQGQTLNTIVVDEAHFVKNPSTGRTKALYGWLNSSENALFLTGTPQENSPEEFIEIASLINPEAMGKLRHSYMYLGPEMFRKEVSPIYLRRNIEEVVQELPDLIETTEYCTFEGADLGRYYTYRELGNWMGMRRSSFIPNDAKALPDKMVRIMELIDEAYSLGRKVIVFSYFKETLNLIRKNLPGPSYGPVTGATTSQERQQIIDDYTNNPYPCTIIGQIQALGTGLNIQAASVVIICEPQIKPSLEVQAIARSYRMGQVNKVYVFRLVATDHVTGAESIDEYITGMLVRKTDSFNQHARISELGNASAHLIAQDLSSETEIKQWVSKNNFKKKIDDFYELLQVTDTATEDDLRKSFEKLMSELEIDEESKNDEIYTKTQKIKLAYEVLMDERMRKNYDKIRNRDKNMQ